MSLVEFDIIKRYFTRPAKQQSVSQSVGDDCAVLTLSSNKQLVLSMDTLVCGRHFPEDAAPYDIATRALCTSLSDLAAMGAKPLWFTLGLTLPAASHEWLSEFSQGLFAISDRYNVDLIGGDTTQGPLAVTIQVHGEVDQGQGLCRHSAQVGDSVFVTGCLGDGAAALAVLQGEELGSAVDKDYLLQRFYQPFPQIAMGQYLQSIASAAIDISDGLVADARHIARASQVDMVINTESLPLSDLLSAKPCYYNEINHIRSKRLEWALTGGDDYQLLFTVHPEKLTQLQLLIDENLVVATNIGFITAKSQDVGDVVCYLNGGPYSVNYPLGGYQHFVT